MFEDVKQWVEKNVKEDANLEEFMGMLPKADELPKHPEVLPFFDSAVTSAVKNHDRRFQEEKLPDIKKSMRDELMKELHPEETPQDAVIRELREKVEASERRDRANQVKSQLRRKYTELDLSSMGVKVDYAEGFAAFGEEAESMLETNASQMKNVIEAEVNKQLKERLGGKMPKVGDTPKNVPTNLDEANELARTNPDGFDAVKAQIIQQEIEKAKTS